MARKERLHLPTDLQVRHVRVQIEPVHTLQLERHMTLEHLVDVRHARHRGSMTTQGPASPARRPNHSGRGPWGGPALPTLIDTMPTATAMPPNTSSTATGFSHDG